MNLMEQINQSIELTNLDAKSADELGSVWVLAKSLQEKLRKNSPEDKLLTSYMAKVHKLMRSKARTEPTPLTPAEQERLANAT